MQNKNKAGAGLFKGLALALSFSTILCCTGCKQESHPIVIWTDNPEFASYVEYFNITHEEQKAIIVYKEEPAKSLPPAKDELVPDIIIGPWLKNSSTKKYFSPLDYLFTEEFMNRSEFYSQLIDYGIINEKQYLLPVSFNLPMMVFSEENENLIPTSHLLSPDEIKSSATSFNSRNRYDEYASMGYAPLWDNGFRYEITKLYGANYEESDSAFTWNNQAMEKTAAYFRDWTTDSNTSSVEEENFQFKYLYQPKYKQITSGRCLYTFMNSDDFFKLNDEQSEGLTFRWISKDEKIPVSDNLVMMGLYRNTKNEKDAVVFIEWFLTISTQQKLLQRTESMELNTRNFGIASGFSSIKKVNETVFPAYYRQLLENLPTEAYLKLPNNLPYTWPKLKEAVIDPYLLEYSKTTMDPENPPKDMNALVADWNKQYF